MTVAELREALVPYGDHAEIRMTVIVDGREMQHKNFTLRSYGIGDVDFVIHMGNDVQAV